MAMTVVALVVVMEAVGFAVEGGDLVSVYDCRFYSYEEEVKRKGGRLDLESLIFPSRVLL